MIEYVEELRVEAQPHMLAKSNRFRQVEITPGEIRAAQRVTAEVPELTIRGTVAIEACASARVHGGDEGIRIEPLNRARLCDAWNRMVFVERYAGNNTRKLWTTAVHDAVSIG